MTARIIKSFVQIFSYFIAYPFLHKSSWPVLAVQFLHLNMPGPPGICCAKFVKKTDKTVRCPGTTFSHEQHSLAREVILLQITSCPDFLAPEGSLFI